MQLRKNIFAFFLIAFLVFLFFLPFGTRVLAVNFSQAYIRLDRLKANTALSGLVCGKPSSAGAGTETSIVITFPSDFTLSTTASSWTTTATNLPAGATSWPGIGSTATTVSGQTVTFASSDLTSSSTLYCFNFTASSSTTGSAGGKTGSIATKDVGSTTINSTDYGVTITEADQIAVSATVPANSTDFSAGLASLTSGATFPQSSTIQYELTYGSNLSYTTAITVEASWTLGTIEGSGTPTVEILDYVIGSASNAYNSTAPVVDLTNRKITWTISSLPGNTTGQTVTFSLKTNSSYTGSGLLDFDVNGRILGPGTATSYSTVSKKYQYNAGASPTATPTPGPTSTPKPGATSTPTPTPTPTLTPLSFNSISMRTISASNASASIHLSRNATLRVSYGTGQNNLTQTITSSSFASSHTISFSNLTPKTTYYFRVSAAGRTGDKIVSDVFTFTTAEASEPPRVQQNTVVITSQDIVLYNPALNNTPEQASKAASVSIPVGSGFAFEFTLKKDKKITSIQAVIQNKSVLGAFSFLTQSLPARLAAERAGRQAYAESFNVEIKEFSPGVYYGRMKTPSAPGEYEIWLRIKDEAGNLTEQKITDLRVMPPFRVFDARTKEPINAARILFWVYDEIRKSYIPIRKNIIAVNNPSFADINGELIIVLPPGKYRVQVGNIGYTGKKVDFVIGPDKADGFPTVYLEPAGFSLTNVYRYYRDISLDTFNSSLAFFLPMTESTRNFNFLRTLSLLILVIFTFLAFLSRIKIPLHKLVFYLRHQHRLASESSENIHSLKGQVSDAGTDAPVVAASVYILKRDTHKILSHVTTDRQGGFRVLRLKPIAYSVSVMKDGYLPFTLATHTREETDNKVLHLALTRDDGLPHITTIAWRLILQTLSSSFEILLVTALVFEGFFLFTFGWQKTLPFLLLSLFNLSIWLWHLRILRRHAKI